MTARIVFLNLPYVVPLDSVSDYAQLWQNGDENARIFSHYLHKQPGQLWERLREHSEQRPKPKWFRPFPIQEVVDARLGEESEKN